MSGLTRAALDAIRERAEAATEGPWHSHDFGHAGEEEPSSIVVHVGRFDHSDLRTHDTETAVAWMPRWEGQEHDNATFIAHARTDVPDLLAEVERLTVENARLREEVDARTTGQRGGEWVDPEGDYWRDYWRDRAMKAEEQGRAYRNFRSATEAAYELLNPPTDEQPRCRYCDEPCCRYCGETGGDCLGPC